MDFEHIFQATSLCPYTEQCDSYRTMVNSERWMGKALTRLRREGLSALPREEGGYTERGLEERLERLRSVKDRCHRHNGRCLRYWQLKRREENGLNVPMRKPVPLEDQAQEIPAEI